MSNITYFLGAGASYHACPIQNELGEKMLQLAQTHLPPGKTNFDDKKPDHLNSTEDILWDFGDFGTKALKYGTIDTYAKKLIFSNSLHDLERLKLAMNLFFTIWQLTSEPQLKELKRTDKITHEVAKRHIKLMTSIL